uniref:testis-expressed protein 13C-1-like n=1 Tax=Callospermophilus lateralis TaxID=76772 RepID=UPI00403887FC
MRVEFGEHASGFLHKEVVRFINNEALLNSGGPEFYMAFHSCPWNKVEEWIRTVVVDFQVPRDLKRECTGSALALGMRVVARQREQQGHRACLLQDQLEEGEAACWALASELQWLCEDSDDATTQLLYLLWEPNSMAPQVPLLVSYPPGLWAPVGCQEEMALQCLLGATPPSVDAGRAAGPAVDQSA